MCLGVPGKIVQIDENPTGMTMGRVNFGGILKEVCLAYVPEAQVGDYVVVHVGFAISCIDEAEAMGIPMVVGAAVRQMLSITNAQYGTQSDFTSVCRVVEGWAGAEVRSRRGAP